MQSYKSIIAKPTLILSTDSDLFKFLRGMDPDVGALLPNVLLRANDNSRQW